jgi:hypothetical protein
LGLHRYGSAIKDEAQAIQFDPKLDRVPGRGVRVVSSGSVGLVLS